MLLNDDDDDGADDNIAVILYTQDNQPYVLLPSTAAQYHTASTCTR